MIKSENQIEPLMAEQAVDIHVYGIVQKIYSVTESNHDLMTTSS